MTKHGQEAAALHRLDALTMAATCGDAMLSFAKWRTDAGPKRSWSAHTKLEEMARFNKITAKFAEMSAFMRHVLPAHWDMADWGFRPNRTGKQARWAAKNGTGLQSTGDSIRSDPASIAFFLGRMIGYSTGARIRNTREECRMSIVGLSPDTVHRFSFKTHLNFRESIGHTPVDAFARMLATGDVWISTPVRSKMNLSDAFDAGVVAAHETLSLEREWSAGPTLWPRLRNNRNVRRLVGAEPPSNSIVPPWASYDLEDFDRILVAALEMLAQVKPSKASPLPHCLYHPDGQAVNTPGWCGTSALLANIIQHIDARTPWPDVSTLRVFALVDECGQSARQIFEQATGSVNQPTYLES